MKSVIWRTSGQGYANQLAGVGTVRQLNPQSPAHALACELTTGAFSLGYNDWLVQVARQYEADVARAFVRWTLGYDAEPGFEIVWTDLEFIRYLLQFPETPSLSWAIQRFKQIYANDCWYEPFTAIGACLTEPASFERFLRKCGFDRSPYNRMRVGTGIWEQSPGAMETVVHCATMIAQPGQTIDCFGRRVVVDFTVRQFHAATQAAVPDVWVLQKDETFQHGFPRHLQELGQRQAVVRI